MSVWRATGYAVFNYQENLFVTSTPSFIESNLSCLAFPGMTWFVSSDTCIEQISEPFALTGRLTTEDLTHVPVIFPDEVDLLRVDGTPVYREHRGYGARNRNGIIISREYGVLSDH